jgi:adenosylcobinamide amidohydrolase
LRAGDVCSGAGSRTINVLVHIDVPLTDEGCSKQARSRPSKSAALFDARAMSKKSGALATGTGTDCTVVTCPRASWGNDPRRTPGSTPRRVAIGVVVRR